MQERRTTRVREVTVFAEQLRLERLVLRPLQKLAKHLVTRDHKLSAGVVLLVFSFGCSPHVLLACEREPREAEARGVVHHWVLLTNTQPQK